MPSAASRRPGATPPAGPALLYSMSPGAGDSRPTGRSANTRHRSGAWGEVRFTVMAGSPPNGSSGSNDDDLEISIEGKPASAAAAPQQARKRARTPNPVADEVIHTGEIGESRSMII